MSYLFQIALENCINTSSYTKWEESHSRSNLLVLYINSLEIVKPTGVYIRSFLNQIKLIIV